MSAVILAAHQRRSTGMAAGAPDVCACGAPVLPDEVDYRAWAERGEEAPDITVRRDEAFARHQAEQLAPEGLFIAPDADGFPVVWRRNEVAPDRPQMVAQKWGSDRQIWEILAAAIPEATE